MAMSGELTCSRKVVSRAWRRASGGALCRRSAAWALVRPSGEEFKTCSTCSTLCRPQRSGCGSKRWKIVDLCRSPPISLSHPSAMAIREVMETARPACLRPGLPRKPHTPPMILDTTAAIGNTSRATRTFFSNSPFPTIDSTEYARLCEKNVHGSNTLRRKIE